MNPRCEYVGGPRDGDRVCIPVEVGQRVCLCDGAYEVATYWTGELVAVWKQFTADDFDPNEGEDWKS